MPTSVAAPTAPRTYTPRHLAEKILASRAGLEGERKHVTVLFADVVGSTELIRDLDPEDAQRLLDGAVEQMMAAIHSYEGTVSRLMGDGLMALFGAPIAHEDHALRACYAALAMLEAVHEYAGDARQTRGAPIQVRVGLNSGEVVVRLISDDLHMDYTAMGQTVHLAARMEGLARAGTSLLSPTTLSPELALTFKHALTHDVAYGSLLQERRKTLHAQIVSAIEAKYGDRLDEHVEKLAHHAVRGEVWHATVTYARQAGHRAADRSANQAALHWFEQAMVALGNLPENRATMSLAIDLRFDVRRALHPLGDGPRILQCVAEAEALATALDDRSRLVRAWVYQAICFSYDAGDHARAIDYLRRALTVAETLGDADLEILVLGRPARPTGRGATIA